MNEFDEDGEDDLPVKGSMEYCDHVRCAANGCDCSKEGEDE